MILRTQSIHPLNDAGGQALGSGPWDLSFNTAASFVTNTNWQFYGGETADVSLPGCRAHRAELPLRDAGVGIAVLTAVVRGFVRRDTDRLGNFWVDLTRVVLYVLVPVSLIVALFLVSQGVVQTVTDSVTYATIGGGEQTLALGPVASQEALKHIGTNGGGFFNVNSAMPFENPTTLTNFVLMLSMLIIPAAKYFAILPAIFAATYGGALDGLNVMRLGTPESAIISAIVFNALIIPALVPLALRGVRYRPLGATPLLRRNLLVYGLGGLVVPFVGIKLIDLVVHGVLGA
ncbi:MAG: potassium-transporting ATPase subunit KdpA [Solirubrobacterales bacterium]|nr:potassium-transporting ATPase subunit KdpA [Solirubrobacterales bacterium]